VMEIDVINVVVTQNLDLDRMGFFYVPRQLSEDTNY
jgi:hypothetical protein